MQSDTDKQSQPTPSDLAMRLREYGKRWPEANLALITEAAQVLEQQASEIEDLERKLRAASLTDKILGGEPDLETEMNSSVLRLTVAAQVKHILGLRSLIEQQASALKTVDELVALWRRDAKPENRVEPCPEYCEGLEDCADELEKTLERTAIREAKGKA